MAFFIFVGLIMTIFEKNEMQIFAETYAKE